MKNELKNIKISLIFNVLIVVLVIVASIIMFTGFKFMHGYEPVFESTKLGMFRFFTVDSNLLSGIASLIFAVSEIRVLKGNKSEIPFSNYVLKLMAVTAVGLTFFVVMVYLGPITDGGTPAMLRNSNLFLHLIIPVVSILNFVLFEKTSKLKFKNVLYGVVPTLLYSVYYLINILIHVENGQVSTVYDWYWFVQNGLWTTIIVVPIIFGITYIISLIIWRLNRIKV